MCWKRWRCRRLQAAVRKEALAVSTIVETVRLQKGGKSSASRKENKDNEIRDVKYTLLPCRLHQLPSSSAASLPADI